MDADRLNGVEFDRGGNETWVDITDLSVNYAEERD
jgi:hypothetical protein